MPELVDDSEIDPKQGLIYVVTALEIVMPLSEAARTARLQRRGKKWLRTEFFEFASNLGVLSEVALPRLDAVDCPKYLLGFDAKLRHALTQFIDVSGRVDRVRQGSSAPVLPIAKKFRDAGKELSEAVAMFENYRSGSARKPSMLNRLRRLLS